MSLFSKVDISLIAVMAASCIGIIIVTILKIRLIVGAKKRLSIPEAK